MARARMEHVDAHFFARKFQKRLTDGLDRALHVALYDDIERLDFAFGDLAEHVVERHARLRFDHRVAFLSLSLVEHLFQQFILFYRDDRVARVGNVFQSQNGNRHRRARALDRSALVVYHRPDTARGRSGNDGIARFQRAVLNEHGGDGASALIQFRLDDDAARVLVGIGFEFADLRNEIDGLQKAVDAVACLCGYGTQNGNSSLALAPISKAPFLSV